MAKLTRSNPDLISPDATCFYCDERFDRYEDVIYWSGGDSGIALHPICAQRLAVHLIKDVRDCERSTKLVTIE